MAVRIWCIVRRDRGNPHERIRFIGGVNSDSERWKMTEHDAIQFIEFGTYSFYVERPIGHRVGVIVAKRLGHKYLKTVVDGESPDNLLALPDCPQSTLRTVPGQIGRWSNTSGTESGPKWQA